MDTGASRNTTPKRSRWKIWTMIGGGLFLALVAVGCLAGQMESTSETAPISPVAPAVTNLQLSQTIVDLAERQIREYPEVLEAAVSQDRRALSLVVVVWPGTSQERAKELGDNFVRLVKSLSPDTPPGREIGEGEYDYLIIVGHPSQEIIARGAKARGARSITW